MARPKTLKLEGGEVSLQGFEKELSSKLAEYIQNFGKPVDNVAIIPDVAIFEQPKPIAPLGTLLHKAVGYNINAKGEYQIVVVSYNAETKEAVVESVKTLGIYKRDAVMSFKQTAAELNLV